MKRLLVLTALIAMILAGCNKPAQTPAAPALAPEMRGDELMPGAGLVPGGSEMDEGTGPMLPGEGDSVGEFSPPPPPPPPPVVTHVVQPKDTLWSIAAKYYGDGKQWKRIAEANGIADATKLRIGSTLTIPQ